MTDMATQHSPTRREFLHGRSGIDADRVQVVPTPPTDIRRANAPTTGYLLSVTRRAMACTFSVHLNATAGTGMVETSLEALDLVEMLEGQLTVYRETSDVIEVNRRASVVPVEVEDRLFELLVLAQRIARDTDGAFDITTGPLSAAWGFSRRQGRVPDEKALTAARAHIGYEHIMLDEEDRTIFFDKPGTEIQLNGIGKGYALDRAGELLRNAESHLSTADCPLPTAHFLLHGGQSSVLASGDNAARPDGGWSVGIRNPLRPTERLGQIILDNAAIGTSGSATQSFHANGRRYGHVLDPRTGMPADGVYTSSVIAPSAAEADALATAMYVLGHDGAEHFCAERPEIGALLICPGKRSGEIQIDTFNLSPEIWQME